jgi:hypothetical protein
MSTAALYGALRARVLDYGPAPTLRTTLTSRLYVLQAPDDAAYPFLEWRLVNRSTGAGDDGRFREVADLEVQCHARPRAALPTAEAIMDRVESALLHYSEETPAGLVTVRRMLQRDTLPPFPAPADREVVQIRAVFALTWWAPYRTSAGVASGFSPL